MPEATEKEQKLHFISCSKLRSGNRKFCVYTVEWGGNPSRMIKVDLVEVGTGKIHSLRYDELEKLIDEKTMVYE